MIYIMYRKTSLDPKKKTITAAKTSVIKKKRNLKLQF